MNNFKPSNDSLDIPWIESPFFNQLLEEGVYIAPSQFEAGFMSVVHTDEEINLTIEASRKALTVARG